MVNEKLNLQPLHELLNVEVGLDELINHLNVAYYRFTECALKASKLDELPADDDVIVSRYWIEWLKQLFEEMSK